MIRMAIPLALSAVMLAACSDDPDLVTMMAGAGTRTAQASQNTLPQSGQGNSGGVLAVAGQPSVAGVEATMSYNAGGRPQGARLDFHNGPLTGVGVRCTRAGGGATVPECTAINASSAWLVNELSGEHAYAGAFAIDGYGPDQNQSGFVAVHSGPGMENGGFVALPPGSASYAGRFQAGGALTTGGQTFEGRISGDMALNADFASGTVSGTFTGNIRDDRSLLEAPLSAGFSDAQIGLDGRFYNTADTNFSYGGAQAWGELDGAFYGPGAEEAAGAFSFGNSSGGMTGIMLGCEGDAVPGCLHPTPRF